MFRNESLAASCCLAVGLALAGGCATTAPDYGSGQTTQSSSGVCQSCGTISSINPRTVEGQGHPVASTIAGAIVGGVIGHQFGSGKGQDAATAAGAVAGGVAGHQIDKRAGSHTVYDVTIRMSQGGYQTVTVNNARGFSIGDRVEIRGDRVVHSA